MTPAELKSIRHGLDLSAAGMARVLGLGSGGVPAKNGDRTVRRWEDGERDIPGPVITLATLLRESAEVRHRLGVSGPAEQAVPGAT